MKPIRWLNSKYRWFPQVVVLLLVVAGMIIALPTYQDQIVPLLAGEGRIWDTINRIRSWFQQHDLLASGLYVLFYAVANVLFVPVFLLSVTAGLLFDVALGFLVIWLGVMLSAQAFYWAGRFGGPSILDWVGGERFPDLLARSSVRPAWLLFHCRFVFVMPFHPLNATCGALKVSFLDYMAATALGWLPRIGVYVYFGYSLVPDQGHPEWAALALVGLIVGQCAYGGWILPRYVKDVQEEDLE